VARRRETIGELFSGEHATPKGTDSA